MSETKEKAYWEDKGFSFYQNKACEYFPCHKTNKPEEFNCLFCYCPLYALKDKCGGNFKVTEDGIKDCSACMVPHVKKNYGYIMDKFADIIEITRMEPPKKTESEGEGHK